MKLTYNSMYKRICRSRKRTQASVSRNIKLLKRIFDFGKWELKTYGNDAATGNTKGGLTDVRVSLKTRRTFKTSLQENACVASDDSKEGEYEQTKPSTLFYCIGHCY